MRAETIMKDRFHVRMNPKYFEYARQETYPTSFDNGIVPAYCLAGWGRRR